MGGYFTKPTIFTVVQSADIEAMENFLRGQSNEGSLQIDEKDADNYDYTALHYAAKDNLVEIGRLLLHYGASINATTSYGYTPLHLASLWNSVEFGEMLIGQGADLNLADEQGDRPLHIASRENHVKFASMLLASGANFHLKEDLGFMPVHFSKTPEMETIFVAYHSEGHEMRNSLKSGEQKPRQSTDFEEDHHDFILEEISVENGDPIVHHIDDEIGLDEGTEPLDSHSYEEAAAVLSSTPKRFVVAGTLPATLPNDWS